VRKTVAIAALVAALALLVVAIRFVRARATYAVTPQGGSPSEALRNEVASLYHFAGPMQTLMTDASRRYFVIDWRKDGSRIRLDLKECTLQGKEASLSPHSRPLADFAELKNEVGGLPAESILFYGTDDTGPPGNAITGEERVLLNRLLKKKGGRLYCFPGG
jgi:hypothetical protein